MNYEVFPESHTRGGIRISHIPTEEEMENCGYLKKRKAICPRKRGERQLVVDGYAQLIDCFSCPYHPINITIGK